MKRATIHLSILAGLLVTRLPVLAQPGQPSPPTTDSTLRLLLVQSVEQGTSGSVEKLTIRLFNEGKTTLRFPEPAKLCSSMDGFVMVYKKTLVPSRQPEVGRGCAADRVRRTNILAEAEKWKTLVPGNVYDITVPLRAALSLNADATYELRAKYFPPRLSSAELGVLAANGVTVIQQVLESPPIVVGPEVR